MVIKSFRAMLGIAAASFLLASTASANLLSNAGFDADDASGGDVYCASSWGCFNDVFSSSQSAPPRSDPNVLKIFGPFVEFGGAGAVQGGFAASEGQLWEASAYAQNWSGDALQADNESLVKLEFLDDMGGVISAFESARLGSSSDQNMWTLLTASGIAPAGTVSAQIVLLNLQGAGFEGGASFFDDASLRVVPIPAAVWLMGSGLLGLIGLRRRKA